MWRTLPLVINRRVSQRTGWRLPGRQPQSRGFDIRNIRGFEHGDSPRAINRKQLLRTGREIVFEKNPEQGALLLILLDISASERLGRERLKYDAQLELVHHLGTACFSRGNLLQVIAFSDIVELQSGIMSTSHSLSNVIAELEEYVPSGIGTDLRESLDLVYELIKKRDHPVDMVCLLSDLLFSGATDTVCAELRDMKEVTDVVAVCMEDWVETEPPPGNRHFRGRDMESGVSFIFKALEERDAPRIFDEFGIDLCVLKTSQHQEEWFDALSHFFSQRQGGIL